MQLSKFKSRDRNNVINGTRFLLNMGCTLLFAQWFLQFLMEHHSSKMIEFTKDFVSNSPLFAFGAALSTNESMRVLGGSFSYLPLIVLVLYTLALGFGAAAVLQTIVEFAMDKIPPLKRKSQPATSVEKNMKSNAPNHSDSLLTNESADVIANQILSMIPSIDGNAGSDFYKESAREALVVMIGAFKRCGMKYDLYDLAAIMNNGKAMEDLLGRLKNEDSNSSECRNLALFLDRYRVPTNDTRNPLAGQLDMQRLKAILGGMSGRLLMASKN